MTAPKTAQVLGVLERLGIADKRTLLVFGEADTHTLKSCRNIPNLNLKLIAHHGSFLRQVVGGRSQVAGSDVILTHRLLKNEFRGSNAYLLLTDAALRRTGADPSVAGMGPHTETYEHLGAVQCFVAELEPVWRRALEARVVRVAPEEAVMRLEFTLPAPPPTVWEWLTSAAKRQQYQLNSRSVAEETEPGGRPGAGMRHHCDHGTVKLRETVVDWRPFQYCTWHSVVQPINLTLRTTFEFTPDGERTRVTLLGAPAPDTPWWKRRLLRAISGRVTRALEANFANLRRLLQADRQ
jgi:uncharacterized protein YndB with AHSA1/START domain